MGSSSSSARPRAEFGLCGECTFQRVITNTRGSVFSLCERGLAGEPGYAKYPRLPVKRCDGFKFVDGRGGPDPRDAGSPAA
jgi:hypothetical protein